MANYFKCAGKSGEKRQIVCQFECVLKIHKIVRLLILSLCNFGYFDSNKRSVIGAICIYDVFLLDRTPQSLKDEITEIEENINSKQRISDHD